jgi:protein-disulfide isomerase
MTKKKPTRKMKATKRKQNTQRMRQAQHKQRGRLRMIGIGILALLIIGAFILWPRPKAREVSAARLANDPSIGSTTALVTIVEYADFGCPACRSWHFAGIRERVISQYGDQVRFIWRDFPVITAQSPKAAEAAQCAYDQDQFWQYHDVLFDRAPALNVSALKSYAAQLGLDTDVFNTCLDSGQHRATVNHDLSEARQLGLPGTPSFVVNGQRLVGPPTYEVLQSLIEEAINSGG